MACPDPDVRFNGPVSTTVMTRDSDPQILDDSRTGRQPTNSSETPSAVCENCTKAGASCGVRKYRSIRIGSQSMRGFCCSRCHAEGLACKLPSEMGSERGPSGSNSMTMTSVSQRSTATSADMTSESGGSKRKHGEYKGDGHHRAKKKLKCDCAGRCECQPTDPHRAR